MIVRSPRISRNFTILSNTVGLDTRLSPKALGILVRLLCRPDHWQTNSESLAVEFKVGRDAIRTGLRELAASGYMQLVRTQGEDGRWSSAWHVFDEPIPVDQHADDVGKPDAGKPDAGKPVPGATEDGFSDAGKPGPIARTDQVRTDVFIKRTSPEPTGASEAENPPSAQAVAEVKAEGPAAVATPEPAAATPDAPASPAVADKPKREKKPRADQVAKPDDVSADVWNEWVAHRTKKRSTVTDLVVRQARSEAGKAGMTLDAFLCEWVYRGTVGLKAAWMPQAQSQRPSAVTGQGAQGAAPRDSYATLQRMRREGRLPPAVKHPDDIFEGE